MANGKKQARGATIRRTYPILEKGGFGFNGSSIYGDVEAGSDGSITGTLHIDDPGITDMIAKGTAVCRMSIRCARTNVVRRSEASNTDIDGNLTTAEFHDIMPIDDIIGEYTCTMYVTTYGESSVAYSSNRFVNETTYKLGPGSIIAQYSLTKEKVPVGGKQAIVLKKGQQWQEPLCSYDFGNEYRVVVYVRPKEYNLYTSIGNMQNAAELTSPFTARILARIIDYAAKTDFTDSASIPVWVTSLSNRIFKDTGINILDEDGIKAGNVHADDVADLEVSKQLKNEKCTPIGMMMSALSAIDDNVDDNDNDDEEMQDND